MAAPDSRLSPKRLAMRKAAARASFRVPLDNTGKVPLRLPRSEAQRVELTSASGSIVATARLSGKVAASSSGEVRLKLALPPSAAPGVYHGSARVGETDVPVSVAVPVVQTLSVHPDRVVVQLSRGGTEKAQLLLSNEGNVPIEVDHPGAVVLEPRDRSCRILRRALALSQEDISVPPLNALLRAAAESTQSDTLLAARLADAPFTLAPGESRMTELSMRIHAPSRGVYRARLSIGGTRVRLDVHASKEEGVKEP